MAVNDFLVIPVINAQVRDELWAEMTDVACWVDDADPEDEQFAETIEFFFACLARIYRCSAQTIREHYASEIGRLGSEAYFLAFSCAGRNQSLIAGQNPAPGACTPH